MVKIKTFAIGFLETNCYLVYSDTEKKGFLIDPGNFDKRVKNAIQKEGITITNIINTHGHADHMSGNKKFGYPVLIHEADKDFLSDSAKNLSFFTGIKAVSPPPAGLLKDGDVIAEGEIKIEVIHTPGHTPGGISLKMGNKIFTGDTLFCEGVGRTDFPYASENDLLQSIKKRLMVFPDDTEIFPGHGPSSTIGRERKANPFLG